VEQVLTTARPRLRTYDPYRVATAGLVALLVIIVMLTFRGYAISNDEGVQQRYGELIIDYYASGMTDLALFHLDNLYLYGGLFDVVATLLAKVVPLDLYDLRHLLCALIGVGGIAATGAAARMIAGSRAGFIAALMLTLCGAWYGAIFNHTKDIPFAAAMIAATYFLLRIARDLPKPRWHDVLLFGLLTGAALGIRAMGLLLPIYAGLAVLMRLEWRGGLVRSGAFAFIGRSIVIFAPAFVLAYLIMAAAWPWSVASVFNPVRAILDFAAFNYPIRTLLDGKVYEMAEVPRWYVPTYLMIRLPLILLAGVVLALILPLLPKRSQTAPAPSTRELALVAFTAAFPVLCNVIGHGPAFTGLRHFLFVVPPLAVLAGVGCDGLLARLEAWRRSVAVGVAAIVAAILTWNAIELVRLHPYENLFYNPLVGGLAGAAGRYETDYWVNMLPDGIRGLEAYLATVDRHPRPYLVTVCAERTQFERMPHRRLQWTDDWEEADFFIAPTHMNCDRMLEGTTIVKIERSGILIGVVKDRRDIKQGKAAAHAP
jgi:hypothetical protein